MHTLNMYIQSAIILVLFLLTCKRLTYSARYRRELLQDVFMINDTSAVYDLLFPLLAISPLNFSDAPARKGGEKPRCIWLWLRDRSERDARYVRKWLSAVRTENRFQLFAIYSFCGCCHFTRCYTVSSVNVWEVRHGTFHVTVKNFFSY